MVRVLQFAQTFLASGQSHTPTLWAGTNQGAIYVFQVSRGSMLRYLVRFANIGAVEKWLLPRLFFDFLHRCVMASLSNSEAFYM